MRVTYWSSSKFSKWIQIKFAGVQKPSALPMGEWATWKYDFRSKSPFVYWFTEEFLDDVQKIVNWPKDQLNEIRYYFKNRFGDKTHYLQTRLTPGKYYEVNTRLLHGMFETLVDFIEIEKAWIHAAFDSESRSKYPGLYKPWFLRWRGFRCPEAGLDYLKWEISLAEPRVDEYGNDMSSPRQAEAAKEQLELYNWWKKRADRKDPYDEVGVTEFRDQMDSIYGESPICDEVKVWGKENHQKLMNMYDQIHLLEQKWYLEDEEMMIRLIKIRDSLWT